MTDYDSLLSAGFREQCKNLSSKFLRKYFPSYTRARDREKARRVAINANV